MHLELTDSIALILVMYISASSELYFKMYSFWNEVSYLVLLDTLYINLPAKMLLEIHIVRVFIKIIGVPDEDFFRNDRRVHRFILCQNYMMFWLVL